MAPRTSKAKRATGRGGGVLQNRPAGSRSNAQLPQDRPSDRWPSVDTLPDNDHTNRIKQIISEGNWEFLCAEALKHYPRPAGVTCTANLTRVVSGMFNVAFELSFSNNTYWVVRIRTWTHRDIKGEMLSEVATMKLVKERTSIPIPTVYAYGWEDSNEFGFPYMLISMLSGRHAPSTFPSSLPAEFKPKVASQLAQYIWELSQITFDQIGRVIYDTELDEKPRVMSFPYFGKDMGPFNSSSSYFIRIRREVNEAVSITYSDDDEWATWSQVCQVHTGAIPLMLCPQFRRGPFPLYHRDLHYNNILLNDNFDITGILDWSGARTVPIEQFTVYHDFLVTTRSEAENRLAVEFRDMFIRAYKQLEVPPKKGLSFSNVFGSPLPDFIRHWDAGMPRTARRAKSTALFVLQRLYGNDATMEDYKVLRKRPRRLIWTAARMKA